MADETRTLHPEWLAENEPTPFPFADTASLHNATVFISPGTFLDAVLHPIGGLVELYLSRVVISATTATLYVGDSEDPDRAFITFDLASPPDSLALEDQYERPAGLLISDSQRISIFQAWPIGEHVFTPEQTGFAAVCCVPTPEVAFRGFVLEDGSVITGDIWLVGEDGIVLTPEVYTPVGSGCTAGSIAEQLVIRVDVIGDPLFRRRICDAAFNEPRFLEQVTLRQGNKQIICRPDVTGDLKLTAGHQLVSDAVLRIRPLPGRGLVFEAVGQLLEDL